MTYWLVRADDGGLPLYLQPYLGFWGTRKEAFAFSTLDSARDAAQLARVFVGHDVTVKVVRVTRKRVA